MHFCIQYGYHLINPTNISVFLQLNEINPYLSS